MSAFRQFSYLLRVLGPRLLSTESELRLTEMLTEARRLGLSTNQFPAFVARECDAELNVAVARAETEGKLAVARAETEGKLAVARAEAEGKLAVARAETEGLAFSERI